MSSVGLRALSFIKNDRRRTARGRASHRYRFGLELQLLEDRITPTTVTGLNPSFGPAAGGTLVTITGTNFLGATVVDFGTNPATGFTVVSNGSITAESPAGTGAVDVTVTAPSGTSPTSPNDLFTYAPTVASLTPSFGPAAGGTSVTIDGTGFTGATVVDFGTTAATNLTFVSDTELTVDSPAGTGTVDVTVTTPSGTSSTSPDDLFTYGPTVSMLSPAFGPAAGGTSVTITGTDFTGATAVDFGTNPATSFTVVSGTSITAESPAGTSAVDVTVTTPSGVSPISPADVFTYAPTVSAVDPTHGPAAGDTLVTITGTGFTGATAVDFGTAPATNLTVVSDTSLTVDSPAGTGTVDVTVTTPSGTSATSSHDQFTYVAAPVISGLNPTLGPEVGGTVVTITGTGFTGATAVDFGTTPATSFTVVSATSITAASPAGTGTVDVTVTTAGGPSATVPADRFTYVAAPVVSSLSPTGGPLAGGTLVTITGTGFTGATAVFFGSNPATDLTVVSATSITVDSPAGTGTVDVRVTTPGGTSATSPSDQFNYGPVVTSISPNSGPPGGGTLVTISGSGFVTGSTVVNFGAFVATIDSVTANSITAVSPAGTGTVNVTVTVPSGTSAISPADQFTYFGTPTVSGISPTDGPASGGTLVTVTGTGFTLASAVDFGTTPGTNLTIVSDTSLTVDSPAGTGTVDVTVVTPGGMSPTSPADQFTFAAAPAVTGLDPAFGPAAGGTMVTITGTGFTGATAVDFGAIAASSFTVVSATSITADSPAGTGTVHVTVTTLGGTSPTVTADQFTYAPTVASINPTSGVTAGGTLVTVMGTGFTGVTAVHFGTAAATDLTIVSPTELTVDSPPGTGLVNVTVTSPSGTSPTSPADQFNYSNAPAVLGLSPSIGPVAGGTVVTITGLRFTGATAVDFGPNAATSFTVDSDTTITAVSPAGISAVDVRVTSIGGTSPISPADHFTYAPAVSGVSPAFGPSTGGTTVTISGAGFTGATAVDFGSIPATSFTIVSDVTMTAVSPAGTGVVNVTVTGPGGTSVASNDDVFTYAPVITLVSPASGPSNGGTVVTITGTSLANVLAVFFGSTPATTLVSDSATQIQVVSPASSVFGAVNIVVETAGGTSPLTVADQFVYTSAGVAVPRVTGISPKFGPPTGGNVVTITGSGFDFNTPVSVFFGTTAATGITVINANTVTAVSPAGSGTVDVTAVTLGGQSLTSTADLFTYVVDGPRVTDVQRFGFHAQPTFLVIDFNGPLEPAPAQRTSNYQLVGPSGRRIKVTSAKFNAKTDAVTLALGQRLTLSNTYRLTINGVPPSGLTNPDGVFLDGANTGQPGSNFVTSITRSNLAGSASQRPVAAVVKARARSLILRVKSAIHKHVR
jgi:large repetitive protein